MVFLAIVLGACSGKLVFDRDRKVASIPSASSAVLRNWGIENPVANSHIHARQAWRIEEGSKDVIVAVIDTGIDPNHVDLKGNIWRDKKTGAFGWDFTKDKPNPFDEHGHGTHVAGIIGATLNARAGISGVAHKVSIMAVKYYSEGASGPENLANSIRALNYAIDHKASIINYSGGGPEFSVEEYAALKRARAQGILVVVAAGNEHSNGDLESKAYYPCAYRLDNIVCVAATNIRNELLPSSNWGKMTVDIAAPGESILSTVPGGGYAHMSGSSQSTGFGTGTAALLKARYPDISPQAIKSILRDSADKVNELNGKVFSGGKLNAAEALALLDRRMIRSVKVASEPVATTVKLRAPAKSNRKLGNL